MRAAHVVSIGSVALRSLTPYCEAGKNSKLSYDTRTSFAIFRSFSASDYISSQCIRRRLMEYHLYIFKNVDVIVTPTTGLFDVICCSCKPPGIPSHICTRWV